MIGMVLAPVGLWCLVATTLAAGWPPRQRLFGGTAATLLVLVMLAAA